MVANRYGAASPPDAAPIRVPMKRVEHVFHIVTMITQFGGIMPMFQYLTGQDETGLGDSSPLNSALMAIILAVSLVLGLRYRQNILRALPALTPLILLLLLAIASALWSDYPYLTLRRSGTAITTALWGAYLASRFSLRDIIVMVAESVGIIAIGSLIAGVLVPAFAVNDGSLNDIAGGPEGWRGLVSDKNSLGIVMATGMVTMLYLVLAPGSNRRARLWWSLTFALCMLLLYLSESRTSWVAAAVALATCVVIRLMHRRPPVTVMVLACVLLIGVPVMFFILQDFATITSLLGKDSTLTGRVDLWAEVLPWGARRPWFGYGYAAFWVDDSPITQDIWRELNSYHPPHAHNGWIETYLEIGLVGCVIVALQIVQMVVSTARAVRSGRDVDAAYMFLVLLMILVFNMTEADLIRAPALFWPFLVIGPVAISKILRRDDPARRLRLSRFIARPRTPLRFRPIPGRPVPAAANGGRGLRVSPAHGR
jgi:exopolysaccharide production protein ExoQ